MAMSNRNHFIFAVWTILAHQLSLLFLVDSFSTHTNQPKASGRWQRRDDDIDVGTHSIRHVDVMQREMTATAMSAAESEDMSSPSSAVVDESNTNRSRNRDEKLDMPWSDVQDWALKDNLAKFTVIIPPPITGGTPKRYAMWRTLMREVPELAGYPIPFLLQMHQRLMKKESSSLETPGVLPMVDNFEFTSNGGIVGSAYGLPGIADGTRIQTPSLISAETSVPLGYVTTRGDSNDDGDVGFSYELGNCVSSSSSSVYSSDGSVRSAALAAARRLVVDGAPVLDSSKQVVANVAKDMAAAGSGLLSDSEANRDMAYLGGATAMLLASASAVGMLSHHLTVNVFWV